MKKTKNTLMNFCLSVTVLVFLIIFLELASYVAIVGYRYYSNIELGKTDFGLEDNEYNLVSKEQLLIEFEHAPYLSHRKKDFTGEYMNVRDHKRVTYNPCSSKDALKIFVMGGSTIYASESFDNHTMPSYLSSYICSKGIKVNVTNMGEEGYTLTQDMIRLILEIRSDNIPDIVVFYGGYNEVYSAYQNRQAGLPVNDYKRKLEFNALDKQNLKILLYKLNTFHILRFLTGNLNKPYTFDFSEQEKNKLVNDAAETYIFNYELIKSLEKQHSFKSYFAIQPVIYTKPFLSKKENEIITQQDGRFFDEEYMVFVKKITGEMDKDSLIMLTNAYNTQSSTIFIDPVHKSKEGNKIEAEKIGEYIIKYQN